MNIIETAELVMFKNVQNLSAANLSGVSDKKYDADYH
jgi:hypothetical protein